MITPFMEIPSTSFRPLTIGFLRRGYSASGGVEVYLKGLAEGLRGEGHRVVLLGTHQWPCEAWPGGEVLPCSGKNLATYIREVARHKRESGIDFDLLLSVEKVPGCDLYRTDEGVHAAWLTQRSKYLSPLARWFQWLRPAHREKLALEKELFQARATRRVISISEKISREIVEFYGYPAGQITLIHNGVRCLGIPSPMEREAARRSLGITPREKCILFVGTGWERKGLRFAIRAVEKLALEMSGGTFRSTSESISLLVAGKGAAKRHASPIVRFLGPRSQMAEVYAAADIFLLPSIFDPFSLAAIEALGAGLPVITTAATGISEVMTPGVHGEVIAEPSDVESITEALRRWVGVTDRPEEAREAAVNCLSLAGGFTLERNLRETLAVIHEVVNEKKKEREELR